MTIFEGKKRCVTACTPSSEALWRRSLNLFISSYVFYCGAAKALNLGIIRGENPPVVSPVLLENIITRVLQ